MDILDFISFAEIEDRFYNFNWENFLVVLRSFGVSDPKIKRLFDISNEAFGAIMFEVFQIKKQRFLDIFASG